MTHQVVMKPWAEKVNRESGGTLEIQTFPNGALGRNPGLQTKMLQDGVADIAWVIPSYTPGVYLDDDVFELPNVIQNSTSGSVAAWRLLQKNMLRGYDQYYMIGLFVSSPYTFHTNYPVRKPEDLQGKKIRAVGAISTESVKALGAVPEGMPVTQVVEAMSRGVIDGTTGIRSRFIDFGISRVANSHYLGKIGTVTLGIFMSKAKFESLPPQAKAAIEKNRGEVLSRAFGKMSEDRNAELIAEWKKDRKRILTEPTKEQNATWDKALAPVVSGWEAKDARNKALSTAMRQELRPPGSGISPNAGSVPSVHSARNHGPSRAGLPSTTDFGLMTAATSASFLARLERVALIGTRALSVVGLVALMILASITLANGLMRWLLNQPIAGVVDVGALAIAIAVSCCIPISMMERSHITFRLVSSASPGLGRVLDVVADIAVAVILGLMAWQFWVYAGELVATGERTYVLKNSRRTVLVCIRRDFVDRGCRSACCRGSRHRTPVRWRACNAARGTLMRRDQR